MNKEKKISVLDYFIVLFVVLFFAIVSMYSYVIWPREEKFKSIDRSRMERIADAEILYKDLTGDYTNDSFRLFALMESVRDTLYGDSLFIGPRDIVLAKKIKRYVVNNNLKDIVDTLFVDGDNAFSFEFSEKVRLYTDLILDNFDILNNKSVSFDKDSSNLEIRSHIQDQIISNLIEHNASRYNQDNSDLYEIRVDDKIFTYTMDDYDQYVKSNIYAITPSDIDTSESTNIDYYKSILDGKIIKTESDLRDVTVSVNVPKGFRYKLDTTFTTPIKIEEKYNDTIIALKLLSFEPTDNFIDKLNGKWDEGEEFVDALNGYWDEGEPFEDTIGNYIYDEGEVFFLMGKTAFGMKVRILLMREMVYMIKVKNL